MDTLAQIAEAVATIEQATVSRDQLMQQARDEGKTWRAIATAAAMTEVGVRKALGRAGSIKLHETHRPR